MKRYRIENIAESYKSVLKPCAIEYGKQILYEVEEDLIAMNFALSRMKDFLEYHEKQEVKPSHFSTIKIGFYELLKRVSEYSCPHNLKEHLRTKKNCPLKDNCKCLQSVQ